MWTDLVYAAVLSVLLLSNVWLLRELDALKRQLEAYQHEVASLDDRVCQLMYSVEDVATVVSRPAVAAAPAEGN